MSREIVSERVGADIMSDSGPRQPSVGYGCVRRGRRGLIA
jgi:hypothetical protein